MAIGISLLTGIRPISFAGLRKKGLQWPLVTPEWIEFLHAGQCINAPVAHERRVDYRESIGNGTTGLFGIAVITIRARMSLSTERGL